MEKCDYYLGTPEIKKYAAMTPTTDQEMDLRAIACELLETTAELERIKKAYGHKDEPVFAPPPRICLLPGCENEITARNRSGVCTSCWNGRPDETAMVWEARQKCPGGRIGLVLTGVDTVRLVYCLD